MDTKNRFASENGINKFKEYVKEVSNELNMICEDDGNQNNWVMGNKDGFICLSRREIPRTNYSGTKNYGCYVKMMRIRDDLQSQGIGTNWVKTINLLSKNYPFPLFLIPSQVDYEKDIYIKSKQFLEIL